MPTVSIITPCYNSASYVETTIESVQTQTFTDWEHIIVDDGSTDESASLIAVQAAQDPRIRLIRQKNKGVCSTRNRGMLASSAKSKYLLFLDADDVLAPKMLSTLVGHLDQHPSVGLAYCDLQLIDENGCSLPYEQWTRRLAPSMFGVREIPPNEPYTPFATVFGLTLILPSLCLIRRSVYEQTSGWDEDFQQHFEDSDLVFQIAIRSDVHFINQRLVLHRRHPNSSTNSISQTYAAQQKQKLYSKWLSLPGLTAEQQHIVQQAKVYVDGKLIPFTGVKAASKHLKSGDIGAALRFYFGAALRIARSILKHPGMYFTAPRPRSFS